MASTTGTPVIQVTDDMVEAYRRDGFLLVPGLYTPQEMLAWKATVQALLETEMDALPSGVRVWMPDVLHPDLKKQMCEPRVVGILTRLLGPNVEFLSVKAVFKNKATTFGSPWHQDWFYWKGASKISVWIALDDATPENGCLKMIPGSHGRVFKMKQVKETTGFGWRVGVEELAGLPQQTVAARRGDAIFFHDLAVHGSHPNATGADRWSLISTYRDASVKDDATTWKHPMLLCGKSVNI